MEEKRNYSSFDWFDAATSEDIINTAIRQGIENIVNTASIARVTAVNKNTVDIELLNGDKLINVPVCAAAFNGWTVSLPLKTDDTGIVIFMKYEISDYKSTGEFTGESLCPFSQNNGLFIPFALYNQPEITDDIIITNEKINLTINADNEVMFTCEKDSGTLTINFNKDNEVSIDNEKANILIDKDGGLSFENEKGSCSFDKDGVLTVSNDGGQISMDAQGNITIKGSKAVIDADNIELGNGATEKLVLGNTMLQEMNKLLTTISTHTHLVETKGSAVAQSGTAAPSTDLTSLTLASSILSTQNASK